MTNTSLVARLEVARFPDASPIINNEVSCAPAEVNTQQFWCEGASEDGLSNLLLTDVFTDPQWVTGEQETDSALLVGTFDLYTTTQRASFHQRTCSVGDAQCSGRVWPLGPKRSLTCGRWRTLLVASPSLNRLSGLSLLRYLPGVCAASVLSM